MDSIDKRIRHESDEALSRLFASSPKAGGGKPYVVNCGGQPWAGFDSRGAAESALAMYQRNPSNKDGKSRHIWELVSR